MKHSKRVSKCREVSYCFYPCPEVHPMRPVELLLERAKREGVITAWRTSRTGQSWDFCGPPSAGLRALRREMFAILGGPGHCLTPAEYIALGEQAHRRLMGWAP